MKKIDKKILIVEDDKDFLFILQKVFTKHGFSVVTAKDGELAVEVAASEKPDLILSDVLMPRLDGPGMAKKLQESKIEIPVIFLTNVDNKDNSKKFDYLIKSKLRIDEIVEKVKRKLEIK